MTAMLLIAAYCIWAVRRPLPAITAIQPVVKAQTAVPKGKSLAWPAGGQAAVGIAGSTILETHGKQTGVPTASTAKLITVLCVLQKKPLALGQQGPTITLTQNDVNIYASYLAKDGSLVPVKVGEKITEYQMLEVILLPSANNMADSLAIRTFGSLQNYSKYANDYVKSLGLASTHIGNDASGFNASTVSSAHDLTKLGEIAMSNPVLAQIVGKPTASGIPIVNKVNNVNFLLGTANIVGVKTGDTDQAGGVFIAAAKKTINGKPVTIVTTVMGAPDIFSALKSNLNLSQSAQNNFKSADIIKASTVAGRYQLPWGGSVSAMAEQDLKLSGWAGSNIPFTVNLHPIPADAQAGRTVGTLTIKKSATNNQKTVAIKLRTAPTAPSIRWRLLHPLK